MNKKSRPSVLDKVPTGIAGFDRLTGGGLPARRNTLILGSPGSGKTTFALQALVAGAHRGDPGIFVSFTEPPRHLVERAGAFGWDLAALERDRLIFLDNQARARLVQSAPYDLSGLLAGLRSVALEIGAKQIIFDSLHVLLTLLDSRPVELQALFRVRDWLFENGFTGLMTAVLADTCPARQRQACLEFVADCAVALQVTAKEPVATRSLRVLKHRGSACAEKSVPFVISAAGFEVLDTQAGESEPSATPAGMQFDIQRARTELDARLKEMNRFLEIKQAEMGFLRQKPAMRSGAQTRPESFSR